MFFITFLLWGEVGITYILQDKGYSYQSGSIYYNFDVLAALQRKEPD